MGQLDDHAQHGVASAELSQATERYLAKEISPAEYLRLQQLKIPSTQTMLRSLNEHPESVLNIARSSQRAFEEQAAPGGKTESPE